MCFCFQSQSIYTDLFIKNRTLKTIDHTGLIFSGIHIYPMLHVSCKFGNGIQSHSNDSSKRGKPRLIMKK